MYHTIVTLKKGEGRTIKAGGMWIYDNEIASILGDFENGDLVTVHDFDGYFMGYGFLNMNSKIRVRMMSRRKDQVIDEAFLERRVRNAWEYRKTVCDTSCCRVIFGEADFLPGLVVDKFSDVLVVESLALGIDRMKLRILDILKRVLAEDGIVIRGIYERSDAKVREQEGMKRQKGFIGDPFDTKVEIQENGVRYLVNVEDGQKTGFFLDQKYNRLAVQRLCKGKKVLDCFTHTGSFALNAAVAGASSVLGVDASELGCEQARENARLNQVEDRVTFRCTDVFELLPELERKGETYDVVILDPPAFTKSRNSIKKCGQRLPGDQSAGHEAGARRRLSGNLLLLSFHGPGIVRQDAPGGCPRRAPAASPGRIPYPGLRPPDPVGRGSVVLSEILHFPGGGRNVG